MVLLCPSGRAGNEYYVKSLEWRCGGMHGGWMRGMFGGYSCWSMGFLATA